MSDQQSPQSQVLAECPCCNAEANVGGGNAFYPGTDTDFYIVCSKCGMRTSGFKKFKDAVAAWNTRAKPQPTQEATDALRTLIVQAKSRIDHDFVDFNGTHTDTCPACKLEAALARLAVSPREAKAGELEALLEGWTPHEVEAFGRPLDRKELLSGLEVARLSIHNPSHMGMLSGTNWNVAKLYYAALKLDAALAEAGLPRLRQHG